MNAKTSSPAAADRAASRASAPSKKWLFLRRDPAFMDPLRRLYDPPGRLIDPYVRKGQIVADLGCGSGYFTFPIADRIGPQGRVYAVDLDDGCIRHVQETAKRLNYLNVETHASSATELPFIPDRSVDFVLANGLLCSMHADRPAAVAEIKRILKPTGLAFLSLGFPPPLGLVNEMEWTQTMSGFEVRNGGSFKQRWAVVSLRSDAG